MGMLKIQAKREVAIPSGRAEEATTSRNGRLTEMHPPSPMKADELLSITSLLSIVLLTFHLADDVLLGKDVLDIGRLSIYLPIIAGWLCGTLLLMGRYSGYVIGTLGALIGLSVVAIHASGTAGIHGTFFHVWLLIAIGGASLFSLILAVIGLVDLRKSKHPRAD